MKFSTPTTTNVYEKIESVSFTGTRTGLTKEQHKSLTSFLTKVGGNTLVHGGCLGADAEAHKIAGDLGMETHVWPSNLMTWRAPLLGDFCEDPKDPLDRNKDIVLSGEILVACPESKSPQLRSGTWSTVRFARKVQVPVCLIFPDGGIDSEV